jgi:ADP-ribosylglycohydrolase
MAKTTRTQQGIAQKQRPLGTGCLGHNQPTTKELSRTHISTTTHNHTTTTTSSIYPTTHISTIRRYKSYHPRSRLRINQTHTTKITLKHQNKKISPISRIAESFT